MITDYHASYYAHELSCVGGVGLDRIGRALFDACVDLNPHQVEAALFARRSPLSKGVLLVDEVGLGKTIEAGLVLCQYWAERKRRLLVICPASLQKQWQLELEDKFNMPALVLDARVHRNTSKEGLNPFESQAVIITLLLTVPLPWRPPLRTRNGHRRMYVRWSGGDAAQGSAFSK